jgi:hypothetical protein
MLIGVQHADLDDAWNENDRWSRSSACTSTTELGTNCAPSTSSRDRRSPSGCRWAMPGHEVRVVFQHRRHEVVAVPDSVSSEYMTALGASAVFRQVAIDRRLGEFNHCAMVSYAAWNRSVVQA